MVYGTLLFLYLLNRFSKLNILFLKYVESFVSLNKNIVT
jgi:hypothetical protein